MSDDSRYFLTIPAIIDDLGLSPNAFRIYVHLKKIALFPKGSAYPLGVHKKCRMTMEEVEQAKEELIQAGLIEIERINGLESGITLVDLWPKVFDIKEEASQNIVPPPVEDPPNNSGFIYLMRSGNFYKIGYSQNPAKRLKSFKVALPNRVELIHVIATNDMPVAERSLHNKFKHCRLNGEWFELTQQDVAWICSLESLPTDNKEQQ